MEDTNKTDSDVLIEKIYRHLMNGETKGWSELDNILETLEYLESDQLYREAEVVATQHERAKTVRCPDDHDAKKCIIPRLVRACRVILNRYQETDEMPPKHTYILSYYLALTHIGFVITED